MGELGLISVGDLMKGNERMCLSKNRVANTCHLCPEYEKKIKNKEGTFRIKICESRIENPDAEKKIREIERLENEAKRIKEKLSGMKNEM